MLKMLAVNVVVRWREWQTFRALGEMPRTTARRLLLASTERVPGIDLVRAMRHVDGCE
jgi:hypothetical protein